MAELGKAWGLWGGGSIGRVRLSPSAVSAEAFVIDPPHERYQGVSGGRVLGDGEGFGAPRGDRS